MEMDASPPPAPSSSSPAAPSAPAPSVGGDAAVASRSIRVHPLAIIGISDHHTRVVSGGSALPPSAPVVGLLFGHYSSSDGGGSGRDVSIVDAEEVEYPGGADGEAGREEAVRNKIELHRKVFPRHRVVGWYRVRGAGDDADGEGGSAADGIVAPTEDDLRMNQTEMARYCGEGGGGGEEDAESPLFVLMNASRASGDGGGDRKPSSSGGASEEMEGDEELPLTVYETLDGPGEGGGGAVFVNVDFELETYEPERIAVEKVFKTQPSKSAMRSATATAKDAAASSSAPKREEGSKGGESSRKPGKKSKKDELSQRQRGPSRPSFTRGPTELDGQLDSLQSSVRAMNLRMNVLLEFLQKVECGEIAAEDGLLRSIDGLVRQLPLVLAALEEGQAGGVVAAGGGSGRKPLRELENDYGNTMLLTYLAAVAKTARSVHVYSEKFRNAAESGKSDPRRPLF